MAPSYVEALVERRLERMETAANLGYADVLKRLESGLADVDAIQFLSAFCYSTQLHSQHDAGEWEEADHIGQFHNEIAQAVLLRRSSFVGGPVTPIHLHMAREALLDLTHLDPIEDARPEETAEAQLVERQRALDSVRADWSIVRNWAVPSAVEKLVRDTWKPLDDDVEALLGLRVEHVLRWLFAIAEEVERRLLAHHRRVGPVVHARTGSEALRRLVSAFPTLPHESDFADRAQEIRQSRGDELAVRLHVLASRNLPSAISLSLTELVGLYPSKVDPTRIAQAMRRLSLGAGDLAGLSPEELHHSNPVQIKPFIRLDDGGFALAVVPIIQSFAVQIVETLLEPYPEMMARYFKQRGRYLQRRAEELLTHAFPHAEVFANARFRPAGAVSDYENDLMVVLDDTALLVELKANRVRAAARRGAPGSVEDTIENLIIDPAEQALRFENYLRANRPRPQIQIADGPRRVDLRRVDRFLSLTVTYEHLGLWAHPLPLKKAGLIPVGPPVSRPFLLTDLAEMLDLLPSEATRLDFLERRDWIDRNVYWVGDDFDLLSLYLRTHLRVDAPEPNTVMVLTHHAVELQPYFLARERDWPIRKPRVAMSPLWAGILQKIEEAAIEGWLEPCRILLAISPDSQRSLGREVARLVRRIERLDSLGELMIVQPQAYSPTIICAFAYLPRFENEHLAIVSRRIQEILQSPAGPSRALALGFIPGRGLPQAMFTLARRRAEHPLRNR